MADGFKINFSAEDKTSEPMSFEALPSGEYIVNITKIELDKVKNGDNKGKPMMKIEFTVDADNGDYIKRKLWSYVMLFEMQYKNGGSGNFMLAQLLKACGFHSALKTGNIPAMPEFQGKKLIAVVRKHKQDPQYGDGFQNSISGYRALDNGDSEDASDLP